MLTMYAYDETYGKNICDGHMEFQIIFIPTANCSSGEQLLPSWVTCFRFCEQFLDTPVVK